MANFDVFNGDADGLCALHQYRLTYLGDANLVTGAKRDVRLLEQLKVQASDAVTVFDIPIPQNREALVYLLNLGTRVTWFDYHSVGPLARMRGMTAIIDIAPDICTSSVVDRYLGGEHRAWAVVGAFGENLLALANRLAQPLRLSIDQLGQLRQLGQCLNYNAYGETVAELYLHPNTVRLAVRAELVEAQSPFDRLRANELKRTALISTLQIYTRSLKGTSKNSPNYDYVESTHK